MRQINSATLLSLICGAVPPDCNQTDAPTQQVSTVNPNETAQERRLSSQYTHIYDDITASQQENIQRFVKFFTKQGSVTRDRPVKINVSQNILSSDGHNFGDIK
jgi:ABC-type enterochelin transport system ATPase subunit